MSNDQSWDCSLKSCKLFVDFGISSLCFLLKDIYQRYLSNYTTFYFNLVKIPILVSDQFDNSTHTTYNNSTLSVFTDRNRCLNLQQCQENLTPYNLHRAGIRVECYPLQDTNIYQKEYFLQSNYDHSSHIAK